MGGWIVRTEPHIHDMPVESTTAAGVGSEWLCSCGKTFIVSSVSSANHAVRGEVFTYKWKVARFSPPAPPRGI